MVNLKEKFIDILFEDDDDETEISDEEIEAVKETKKSESTIKAKDILYRKSSVSPFVNLTEDKPEKPFSIEEKIAEETYEMSSQISPIFGLIKENKKTVVNLGKEVTKAQVNKPADSHLDIITSPIYGFGNKEDAHDNNYNVKGIDDDQIEYRHSSNDSVDEELHHLFDDNDSYLDKSYQDSEDRQNSEEEISLFKLFGDQ